MPKVLRDKESPTINPYSTTFFLIGPCRRIKLLPLVTTSWPVAKTSCSVWFPVVGAEKIRAGAFMRSPPEKFSRHSLPAPS
jgi:hypothetical protein